MGVRREAGIHNQLKNKEMKICYLTNPWIRFFVSATICPSHSFRMYDSKFMQGYPLVSCKNAGIDLLRIDGKQVKVSCISQKSGLKTSSTQWYFHLFRPTQPQTAPARRGFLGNKIAVKSLPPGMMEMSWEHETNILWSSLFEDNSKNCTLCSFLEGENIDTAFSWSQSSYLPSLSEIYLHLTPSIYIHIYIYIDNKNL